MKDVKIWDVLIACIADGVILVWGALIMTKKQTLAHRMVDVERSREEIAKLILKLADDGEISICNEKELKLILEVQESVGEQKKKMAAEYRRVSELIDALDKKCIE